MVKSDNLIKEHKVYIIYHGRVVIWRWEIQCWLDVANIFTCEVPYKATCKSW